MHKRKQSYRFLYKVPSPSPGWQEATFSSSSRIPPLESDVVVYPADNKKPGWDIPIEYTEEMKAKYFDALCKEVLRESKRTDPEELKINKDWLWNRVLDLACGFPYRIRFYETVGIVVVNDAATTQIRARRG